jgi:hypothetical protein
MPVIQGSISVAANSANDNVLQGSQFEYLPYNARVQFGICGSGVGLLADVFSGSDIVAESMSIPGVNRFPVNPDDFVLSDVAAAGDRLKLRLRNTTGGALTGFWSIQILPL